MSATTFCLQISNQNVPMNSSADDELRNIRCREARRDRYANMPLDKKAELNARKRENYHRRKAEKQSGGSFSLVGATPQSAVLHVSGSACLTATPQIAAMHVAGNAGYNQFTIILYW